MNILYIGNSSLTSTSGHRAHALRRLGHNVIIKDPYKFIDNRFRSKLVSTIDFRTGYRLIQKKMDVWIKDEIIGIKDISLIWVDSGELFGSQCLITLKQLKAKIILYNVDDPTGKRDGHRFDMLNKAIHIYNFVVTVREETKNELLDNGVKNVIKIYRSYDEVMHKPLKKIKVINNKFSSDITFIGTWMRYEKRDLFLLKLINAGLNVTIWGDRWDKSPYWEKLKNFHKGGGLSGQDYTSAIQMSKICLGLLSKGNRDLHTQRSLEIPYAGGVLCAERTSEHLSMYKEWEEAVFWSDEEECIEVCKKLLADKVLREKIRLGGMNRVRENKVGNEDICRIILDNIMNNNL